MARLSLSREAGALGVGASLQETAALPTLSSIKAVPGYGYLLRAGVRHCVGWLRYQCRSCLWWNAAGLIAHSNRA